MTYNEAKVKADKQLQEDKEYLKYRLAGSDSTPGLHKDIWWKSDDTMITVARILLCYDQFHSKEDIIDFFEKPYKYEKEMKFIVEEM